LIVSARGYASSARVYFQKQYFPRRGIAREASLQGAGISSSVHGLFERVPSALAFKSNIFQEEVLRGKLRPNRAFSLS
jgi:hypothetical protein